MRALYVLVALTACSTFDSKDMIGNGGGSGSGSTGIAECSEDSQCALAAATCCACPTFAVRADDPTVVGCSQVACPPDLSCPSDSRPACVNGACTLQCVATTCTTSCSDGFAIDADGCLTCTCAVVSSPQCTADTDCVRTRADCCGCTRGGSDTAVPAADQAGYDASLMCPPDPQCPSVDTCGEGVVPRCIEGACQLATEPPAKACGTPDLACAPGQQCFINVDPDADQQGLGVCM
ncbi:MAG TPA: hypothetical protein VGF94_06685 [Kofleriaceae bacterium]|jgi:hypothetical protein